MWLCSAMNTSRAYLHSNQHCRELARGLLSNVQAPVGQQGAHVPLPVLPSQQQQPAPIVGLPVQQQQQQQQGPVVVLPSPLLQQVVGSAVNPFLQQGGPAQGPAGGAPPQQQQDQRPSAAVDGQQQV